VAEIQIRALTNRGGHRVTAVAPVLFSGGDMGLALLLVGIAIVMSLSNAQSHTRFWQARKKEADEGKFK
jgi:hypothetical protein